MEKKDMSHLAQFTPEESGIFRCVPFDWTIRDHSKAAGKDDDGKPTDATHTHALVFRCMISKLWHPEHDAGDGAKGAWSDFYPEGYFVEIPIWIIGRDGNPNEAQIKNLAECGVWDGDLDRIESEMPPKKWVHVTVEEDGEFKGKPQFRGVWMAPDAERPQGRGGFKPTNPETMSSLRARFGSKLKAVAGGKPTGKPAGPTTPGTQKATPSTTPGTSNPATAQEDPADKPVTTQASQSENPLQEIDPDEIPF